MEVREYERQHRRDDAAALEVVGLYELDPTPERKGDPLAWPEKFPLADHAGVYLIFDANVRLIYVGKASMRSTLGRRLSAHFATGDGGRVEPVGEWKKMGPRFVLTIATPQPFEAPALEEFLISKLAPPLNVAGVER